MSPSTPSSSTKERKKYNELLNSVKLTERISDIEIEEKLKKLRRLIVLYGIPTSTPNLRPLVWKLLLKVHDLDSHQYLKLVSKGRSSVADKIRNDASRTLKSDVEFQRIVGESKLIRLLDAFAWRTEEKSDGESLYVQGMNVLAAPFLYVQPTELEAFNCFSRFIELTCPLYVLPTLEGVHRGLRLVDKCLQIVDNKLYSHLRRHNLTAEIYAFPCLCRFPLTNTSDKFTAVLTLSACTPPLDQVLCLWDFLLAFGPHMNVLCVIAQVLLMRDDLLSSSSPMKLLRMFPPLDAQPIISIAVTLVRDIPEDVSVVANKYLGIPLTTLRYTMIWLDIVLTHGKTIRT
ncbi:TBC-domain-containing protein [Wallemia mellicola]|nr:TBC-domain-containing protein [Wallemia mellicola]